MHRFVVPTVALVVAIAAQGCNRSSSSSASTTTTNIPAEARDLYNQRCAMCHGTDGSGNGPAGAALNPRPRNFTDSTWQQSVTDDQIRRAIVGGGQAVGKSSTMPANPDLEGRNEVLQGLVTMIRSFRH